MPRTAKASQFARCWVIALILTTWPARGQAPEKAPNRTIAYLPFYVPEDLRDKAPPGQARQIAAEEVRRLFMSPQYQHLTLKAIDSATVDAEVYRALAVEDQRRLSEAFQRQCLRYQADGAFFSRLEAADDGSFLIVGVLYLPDAIKLEGFLVGVNFERETVEPVLLGNAEHFPRAVRETARRNLDRILIPPAEGPEPATPMPLANQVEKKAASKWPSSVRLLGYSRDFIESEGELRKKGFVTLLRDSRLDQWTYQSLKKRWGSHSRISHEPGKTVSHTQVAAPVIDLDPNADPHAREKRLAALAAEDLIVFGHRYQERDEQGQLGVSLILRAFSKPHAEIFSVRRTIPGRFSAKGIRQAIDEMTAELGQKLPFASPHKSDPSPVAKLPGGDVYRVQKSDSLFVIAEKCYGSGRLFEALAAKLGLENADNIQEGQLLVLPLELDGKQRTEDCWKGQPDRVRPGNEASPQSPNGTSRQGFSTPL